MDIRLWWKFDGRYIISNIKNGFINIWKWLPVIWKDRGYDHRYIYDVLHHKLILQKESLTRYHSHVDWKRDVAKIQLCINLIDRVREETYHEEYMKYFNDKHWFRDISGKPQYSELMSEVIVEDFGPYFKKYPLMRKKALGYTGKWPYADKSDRCIAMWISHTNHERARSLLFRALDRYIEFWWD